MTALRKLLALILSFSLVGLSTITFAAEPDPIAADPAAADPAPAEPADPAPPPADPGVTDSAEEPAAAEDSSGVKDPKIIWISVYGGGGVALERELADAPFAGAGLALDADVADLGLYIGATFRWYQHRQEYTVRGNLVHNVQDFYDEGRLEHWLDARLTIAYDVLNTVTDIAQLRIGVAPRYVQFLTDGFDTWSFAIEPYGEVRVNLTDRVELDAAFGFGAGVAGAEMHRSVYGLPKYFYDFSAGFSVDMTDDRLISLEARWQGHAIMYELTERWYQGAQVGVKIGI